MSMKQRVMVLRLYSGRFLAPDGRPTNSLARALQFRSEDAYTFLAALHTRDRNDVLWGMSLEMLEKRKNHYHPISPDDFRAFLVTMKTVRLIADAERLERLAEGYMAQARHAEQMAVQTREKAAALRIDKLPAV